MKTRSKRWWIAIFLLTASLLGVRAQSAQKDLQKLTVGYTPIAGASLPFFIAVEERIFQKYGFEIFPVFMGGSPLINSAILAGEFPIGYTGGGAVISSRLSGSDLIAIASPLPVLTIDGWSRPEIKSISDLRGKRVGVTRFGASSYFSALSMLESGGVKPNEVTFIQNGGVGESFAALTGGLPRLNMVCFLPRSLRRGSRGSKTPRTTRPRSTFYARSTKDNSSPGKMPRQPSAHCGDLPESTMTRPYKVALNITRTLSPARSGSSRKQWPTP